MCVAAFLDVFGCLQISVMIVLLLPQSGASLFFFQSFSDISTLQLDSLSLEASGFIRSIDGVEAFARHQNFLNLGAGLSFLGPALCSFKSFFCS